MLLFPHGSGIVMHDIKTIETGIRNEPMHTPEYTSQLFMILVDALRHDQVDEEHTPFLWRMGEQGNRSSVQEIFAGQLRPAFFAGLHPEESGVGHLYALNPDESPFRNARYIPPVFERSRRLLWHSRQWILRNAIKHEITRGNRGSASYCYLAEIPTRRLPYFGFSEKLMPWEIGAFPNGGILRNLIEAGESWLHLGYPVVDQRTDPLTYACLSRIRPAHRFVFLHYAELDWMGHAYGPDSKASKKALKAIDRSLETLWDHIQTLWADPVLLAFGDHGMVNVNHGVDIERVLELTPWEYGHDYVVFLDSTVARFWFYSDICRDDIYHRLEEVSNGRWLTDQDREQLRIMEIPAQNGEYFWITEPGTVILPSYFQRTELPKGMHGYHPEVQDNWGACISSRDIGYRDSVCPLTEVYTMACSLMGKPPGNDSTDG